MLLADPMTLHLRSTVRLPTEQQLIEIACIDAKMDLNMNSPIRADHFLMEMLTGEPNFIRHYDHIGFQNSWFIPICWKRLIN